MRATARALATAATTPPPSASASTSSSASSSRASSARAAPSSSSSSSRVARPPRRRRDVLLASVLAPPLVSVLAPPARGASTTISTEYDDADAGVVDGTLGSCAGFRASECRSAYDDRPPYFIAPWEFEPSLGAEEATRRLRRAIVATGGDVVEDVVAVASDGGDGGGGSAAEYQYLRAVFPGDVAIEFLLPKEGDAVCETRGVVASKSGVGGGVGLRASMASLVARKSPVDEQLNATRRRLGWGEVPVLRNRSRRFLFVESGFDDFGPVPPPGGMDYGGGLASRLDDDLQ